MSPKCNLTSWLLAAILLIGGCSGSGNRPTGILLITLDTTRADHLGCYGYETIETPNLDRIAEQGALFQEAVSPVPVTLPSHSSMFTGNYPPVHGVRYNGMFRLGDKSVTVAELLGDAGWTTVGMPSAYPLTKKTGVGQGFEIYRDIFEELDLDTLREMGADVQRDADVISDQAIEWLRNRARGPFFLWLHYYDAHTPYEPPFPFSSKYPDRPYDGEIAFVDQQVGRVMDTLKMLGLEDSVVVLVAGDHGESLYDHGERGHSNLVYRSTQHVPLILRAPGARPGLRVQEPVSLVDVAATILDYAGVPAPPMEGISLRPAAGGAAPPTRSLYVESLSGSLSFGWSPLEGIQRGRWKYVRSSSPELYDLQEDPGELNNLYSLEGGRASDMEAELSALLENWEGSPAKAESTEVPLDPDELERLVSLGYVGGSMTSDSLGGPNPRDLIFLEPTIQYARELQQRKAYVEALKLWREVFQHDPDNRQGLNAAVIAAVHLGRYSEAFRWGRHLVERWPDFVPGYVALGEAYVAAGRLDDAVKVFQRGLELRPEEDPLRYRLAVGNLALGNTARASKLAQEALEDGGEAYYRILLAACQASEGAGEEAMENLKRALDDGYEQKTLLQTEPLLEPLRRLPGFEQVIAFLPDDSEPEPPEKPVAEDDG